ncbi:MAG TPA: hypothetical protein VMS60_14115 [Solirubrobacterales bacterium]|nr:hypothetical protein [Solirubrobacterales bacterium]
MDDEMLTQLRDVSFTETRKGFDKEEVSRFLAEVSRWVEGGGGDVVRRRLERIANKSAQMLADAEDGAEGLRREAEVEARDLLDRSKSEADAYRTEAETEAREQLRDARSEATAARESADRYVSETTEKADEYSEQTRLEAKQESDELLEEATQRAKQTTRSAEQRADQMIAEATRQREAIETVISDLGDERDAVVSNVRKLARELVETADQVVNEAAKADSVRPPAPTPEPIEPPQLAAIEAVDSTELPTELVPARQRNGSGAA